MIYLMNLVLAGFLAGSPLLMAPVQAASQLARDGLAPRVMGAPDAPVTVIEYASFTCPHCATAHKELMPKIKEAYVDAGKVKVEFRDFPFDQIGLRAAVLARCAPKESYFAMIDMLFRTQRQWIYKSNPTLELIRLGQMAGVTEEQFRACWRDREFRDGVVAMRAKGSTQYQIDSTPSFIIGGRKYVGVLPYEKVKALIEYELAK